MRQYLEYVPPLPQWIPAIALLLVFLVINRLAAKRRWAHHGLIGCVGSVAIFAITLAVLGLLRPSMKLSSPRDGIVMWGIAASVFLGPVALAFWKLERFGALAATLGATVVGVLSYPVAFLVLIGIACALGGGGCI